MKNFLILIFLAIIFSGCKSYYAPEDINKTVLLNVSEAYSPSIKTSEDSNEQFLIPDDNGNARISYGRRVYLINHYRNYYKLNIIEYCYPEISFIPKAKHEYVLKFWIEGNICKFGVLRRTSENKSGFIVEPTSLNPQYIQKISPSKNAFSQYVVCGQQKCD